ncbi:adiponectin receptor protein 1 [Xylariaceae sp. FL0016]|nr:adiponectin receptor protein 1 [Xylariaceae sp. FL0016]
MASDLFGEPRPRECDDEKRIEPFSNSPSPSDQIQNDSGGNLDLVTYDDLPSWYQDNPFVTRHYRPVSQSVKTCLKSWTRLHNESVNIYSHLIPAVVLFLGEGYVLAYLCVRYPRLTAGDYGVFAFLLLAATACFGVSASYHTLMCHSEEIERIWLRLDLVGIVILILGCFFSGVYVAFWCEAWQRMVYWSMIGSLAFLSIVIVLAPVFQGLKFRTFRLLTFVCMGLSGIAPVIHGIKMFGFAQMIKQSGLPYYLAEGGLFLLGAVVYVVRFPECIFPGKFNLFGSSHQVFHVLVVLATVLHLMGVLYAFDYNYYNRQCSL